MEEKFVNNSEEIFVFGEVAERRYPLLNVCLPFVSTVRSLIIAEGKSRSSVADNDIQKGLQSVKDLLAPAILSTDSPSTPHISKFSVTSEIQDILGIEPNKVAPWATQATHVIDTLQIDGWAALSAEDRRFAQVGLVEFGTRIMEQVLGPRHRWP
ncbi:MAG: hypothetical protein JWL89_608 [Candidatus Saccharibacteria bacterium]|jgi:hypothetical protein|nr:hypothetical protein [Candidatus Saccharibacteria bacterium]